MYITPEMVAALTALRTFARATHAERYAPQTDKDAANAIDLLDNADFFATIDATTTPCTCGCGADTDHTPQT